MELNKKPQQYSSLLRIMGQLIWYSLATKNLKRIKNISENMMKVPLPTLQSIAYIWFWFGSWVNGSISKAICLHAYDVRHWGGIHHFFPKSLSGFGDMPRILWSYIYFNIFDVCMIVKLQICIYLSAMSSIKNSPNTHYFLLHVQMKNNANMSTCHFDCTYIMWIRNMLCSI
jgi:hypothetical protein